VQGVEGGIATLVSGLVPRLHTRGLRVQTLFIGAGGKRRAEIEERTGSECCGWVFRCAPNVFSKGWQLVTIAQRLARELNAFSPHLIVCAGILPAITYGMFVRTSVQAPAVLWEHGPQRSYSVPKRRALALCRHRFRRCLSPSLSSRSVFLKQFPGFPPEHCLVLENGVSPDEFVGNDCPLSLRTGLRVVMPARMDGVQKDQESLVRACAGLASAGHPVRLTLIGDGPAKARLRAVASAVAPEGVVFFKDYTHRIAQALAQNNVVCLSSRWEGLPLTLIEGMMSGLLAMGANVTGITDVVVDGRTGLLFEPHSADAIAAALLSVLQDPQRHEAIAQQGRETALQRWTSDLMADRAAELLHQFAG
jgi:glycosyltransferase involved in cell wall biosynthesis